LTFDGKGGITNAYTVSFAGTILRVVGKATYTVMGDCTATTTTADDTQHYDMRVSPDVSRVDYIETDAGTVISGSASRVKHNDTDKGLTGRARVPVWQTTVEFAVGEFDPRF
jgi:hypothetical protein